MSGGKKRSGFQITSVTSEDGGSPASKPDTSTSPPPPADQVTPTSIVLNGPAFLHNFSPTLLTQQSSSQPTTPVSVRKQRSLEQVGGGASRFRVVRLGQGSGEPYRRGRWTCVDVVEREAELRGVRRVMDSMRHAHSLESLESVGLNEVVAAGGGVTIKSFNMRGLRPGPGVHLQGSAHLLTHSGPPSPTFNYHDSPILSPPPPHTPDVHRPRKVPPPLHLDLDPASKVRTHTLTLLCVCIYIMLCMCLWYFSSVLAVLSPPLQGPLQVEMGYYFTLHPQLWLSPSLC